MTKTVLLVVAVVTAICTAVVLGLLLFAVGVLAAVLPFPATADGLPAPPPAVGQMVVVPAQLLPGTPTTGYPDAFPFGQCTYWVALNHQVSWNGDAGQWFANAVAQGGVASLVPAVGEIVVYAPGGFYAGVGHVAVVVAVTADSYTVSEMNFAGSAVVDERTLSWPDPSVIGFIA